MDAELSTVVDVLSDAVAGATQYVDELNARIAQLENDLREARAEAARARAETDAQSSAPTGQPANVRITRPAARSVGDDIDDIPDSHVEEFIENMGGIDAFCSMDISFYDMTRMLTEMSISRSRAG